MKCPICARQDIVCDTRDIDYSYKGETTKILSVKGVFCPSCGEMILDSDEAERVSSAMMEFSKQVKRQLETKQERNRELERRMLPQLEPRRGILQGYFLKSSEWEPNMDAKLIRKIDESQEILVGCRPFSNEYLEQIRDFYRVGMTYSSNAIEGCTYTLSETKILLEEGLTAGGKPLKDAYAVVGHGLAYDHMFTLLHSEKLTEKDMLFFHSLLRGGLANSANPGQYRTKQAFITGSTYPLAPSDKIQDEMNRFFDFLKEKREAYHPVEFAAQLHKRLIFIHPFADGNGRVTRLLMNTSMIQKGFLPIIIPPVLRNEYIQSLEKAHTNDRDFVNFIGRCAHETQKEMIRLFKGNSPQKW